MKDSLSRVTASYGEQVSTTRLPAIGDANIKGQNNRRQIVFGVSMGLAAGVLTSLGFFAGNMQILTDSLPGVVGTALTYAVIALFNSLRGKPIEEIAQEITDRIAGEEKDDEPNS